MELSGPALAMFALLLAGWTVAAAWGLLGGRRWARGARASRLAARRLARMLDNSPALPLLVRPDGRIEGPDRLAAWLGLEALPEYLTELDRGSSGLRAEALAELHEAVRRTQKTAAAFRLEVVPRGTRRALAIHGQPADPAVAPGGAALLWWFDYTETKLELVGLRGEARRARRDFSALVGLIEAAPLPMWVRGPDLRLELVNAAYVKAVGARDANQVVDQQIELIEPYDGLSAAQIAGQVLERGLPAERIVGATIGSQRRALRVCDLPLGGEGVAGYAFDIEEQEEQARAFRAFREAQRSMLDQLSLGVAQFDGERRLVFLNQPFLRLFALPPSAALDPPDFDRWLDMAREAGRLPETRDFLAWRRELHGWFLAGGAIEDQWTLGEGTHLRILAQPLPDGGLVLLAEDRSEQLALAATRDTLLRTRTATFDSLFEALAVFAPGGRMELWNRGFPQVWGLAEGQLDSHPHIDDLLALLAGKLARPGAVAAIGEVVRAATLDRRRQGGRILLADGRTLEFAGVPLPDGNGLLTLLDVTDSTKAEAALRDRNAALEEADAVKTRFLANMSYEFRTPLTSIGGFAELLQQGVAGELTPQAQDYVAAILASVERLSQQIESVLDLTQSEAGLLPVVSEEIELLPFAIQVVREREAAIEAKGLTLDLRGDRGAAKVLADPRQLGRALGNLVDNAVAATPQGGRILVSLSRRRNGTHIIVSDNGDGMSAADLARALDGYRAGEGGQAGEDARGLGLPLARQLIEAQGGRLELQSERGVGTTATIILP